MNSSGPAATDPASSSSMSTNWVGISGSGTPAGTHPSADDHKAEVEVDGACPCLSD